MKNIKLISLLLVLVIALTSIPIGCTEKQEVNMPIVLLTDFGSEDYRVPLLKGIIYSNNIDANVIDGTHDITAYDITTGAFMLSVAAGKFPENVVFCAIVSAYEQEEVKYLVLTTSKNQIFVLPDNGLLTYVIQEFDIVSIYQITNEDLFDTPIADLSAEDIQAKIAALLASGLSVEDVGTTMKDYVTLDVQASEISEDSLLGTVIYIDHFGNCLTNISTDIAEEYGLQTGDTINIEINGSTYSCYLGTDYSDVAEGMEIALFNIDLDVVQLSINLGDFATTYGVEQGTSITITK